MKVNGLEIDVVFSKIAGVVLGADEASDEEVRSMLVSLYAEVTGSAGPFIRAAPALSEPIARDVTPIAAAIVEMVAAVGNSDEFQQAYEKLALAYATNRMIFFKAYKNAGFSAAQAFALVLQDATKGSIPARSSSFNSSPSKSA